MRLLILVLIAPIFCIAQKPLPEKNGKVFYEAVDSTLQNKSQIYLKAKLYIAKAFVDSKEVIRVDDKEAGELSGKGNLLFTCTPTFVPINYRLFFTFSVSCRDNKYRIQLYDITYELVDYSHTVMPMEYLNAKSGKKGVLKTAHAADESIRLFIANLENSIKTSASDF